MNAADGQQLADLLIDRLLAFVLLEVGEIGAVGELRVRLGVDPVQPLLGEFVGGEDGEECKPSASNRFWISF